MVIHLSISKFQRYTFYNISRLFLVYNLSLFSLSLSLSLSLSIYIWSVQTPSARNLLLNNVQTMQDLFTQVNISDILQFLHECDYLLFHFLHFCMCLILLCPSGTFNGAPCQEDTPLPPWHAIDCGMGRYLNR